MSSRELGLWQVLVFGSAGLLTFLGGWELLVGMGLIDPYFLPAPSTVLKRMLQLTSGPHAVLGRISG
jgi:ABC-type nitrate/sulfonate/bicarbonate transport system permease component